MENINENEMININGGGKATELYNSITKNFTFESTIVNLNITCLKENTIRNLTNKLADNGYISRIYRDNETKHIQITKRQ